MNSILSSPILTLTAGLLLIVATACGPGPRNDGRVTLHTSLNEPTARAVISVFEERTGIRVELRADTERDKTVGLVRTLIEEKSRPRADVFWNSETANTIRLKQEGVLEPVDPPPAGAVRIPPDFQDPEGYWFGFAARARVLIVNTNLIGPDEMPGSIEVFWEQAVLARDRFGFTVLLGVAVAIGLMMLSLPLISVAGRMHRPWALDLVIFLPLAVPALLLGVGLIRLWNHPATSWVYDGWFTWYSPGSGLGPSIPALAPAFIREGAIPPSNSRLKRAGNKTVADSGGTKAMDIEVVKANGILIGMHSCYERDSTCPPPSLVRPRSGGSTNSTRRAEA